MRRRSACPAANVRPAPERLRGFVIPVEKPPDPPFTEDELRAAYALVLDPEGVERMFDPGPSEARPVGFAIDLTTLALLSLVSDVLHARVEVFIKEQNFPGAFVDEVAGTRSMLAAQLGEEPGRLDSGRPRTS